MLKYVNPSRHFQGIPARDLTDDELPKYAKRLGMEIGELREQLIASGVYAEPQKSLRRSKTEVSEQPIVRDETEKGGA